MENEQTNDEEKEMLLKSSQNELQMLLRSGTELSGKDKGSHKRRF